MYLPQTHPLKSKFISVNCSTSVVRFGTFSGSAPFPEGLRTKIGSKCSTAGAP